MRGLIFVMTIIYGCNGKLLPLSPNGTSSISQGNHPDPTDQMQMALDAIEKFSKLQKSSSKFDNLFEVGFVFETCSSSENDTKLLNNPKMVLKVKGLWTSQKAVRVNLQATDGKSVIRHIILDINSESGKLISGYVEGCQKRRWESFSSTPFFPISIFGPFNPVNFYKEINKKAFQAFGWIGYFLTKTE
ncbi:hypothetical protein B9Z55_025665 [Caenorhabditis nigoni]|uniref:Lipoprotein n=1 Tax=Caenorhabditis nigoni TaxID=1611254 RepID=A0A2G5T039_9PELO|nr:hypothetical protein B9Z55_025665 [Caenorhabditis nigoni]